MSNFKLDINNFSDNLYGHFPPKYREDDQFNHLALKRYLQALVEGGFAHSITEWNGILDIVNPSTCDSAILPLLFKQYGLEIFNGLPETYLRYLLPNLSVAWENKGSVEVLDYIVSSLSGIKVTSTPVVDEQGNTTIEVRLEMDYNSTGYFPDSTQFNRIIKNFIPFNCEESLIYSYVFTELGKLNFRDTYSKDKVSFLTDSSSRIQMTDEVLPFDVTTTYLEQGNLKVGRNQLTTNIIDSELNVAFILPLPYLIDTVYYHSTGETKEYYNADFSEFVPVVFDTVGTEENKALVTEDGLEIALEY